MKYEIKGGSFPVVICNLENGEKMITEKGSMAWMSPNMQMETHGDHLLTVFQITNDNGKTPALNFITHKLSSY